MNQAPTPEMLPLTIFLTDGLPTVGETRESAIRNACRRRKHTQAPHL